MPVTFQLNVGRTVAGYTPRTPCYRIGDQGSSDCWADIVRKILLFLGLFGHIGMPLTSSKGCHHRVDQNIVPKMTDTSTATGSALRGVLHDGGVQVFFSTAVCHAVTAIRQSTRLPQISPPCTFVAAGAELQAISAGQRRALGCHAAMVASRLCVIQYGTLMLGLLSLQGRSCRGCCMPVACSKMQRCQSRPRPACGPCTVPR